MANTIDLTTERRLTQLETQQIEIYRILGEIKTATSEIKASLNTQNKNENNLTSIVENLVTDVAAIKKQISQLDTLSFFSKNPKILLYAVLGLIVVFVTPIRSVVANLLLSLLGAPLQPNAL